MQIEVELENWHGSPVVRTAAHDYQRQSAAAFRDEPARLTDRQAVFYRNLIRIARFLGCSEIPVDFTLADSTRVFLDRGCIKIAAHAGFIEQLADGPSGVVEIIRLRWNVDGTERL